MTATTTPTTGEVVASRLQPGGRRMQLLTTWLLAVVVLCALAAGAPALVWIGGWQHLPGPMQWLPVAFIDAPIVVMGLTAVARRGRGEPAGWMWTSVGALVVLSGVVQAAHALPTPVPVVQVVAAVVAAVPPVMTLVASHAWMDMAIAPAPTKRRVAASRSTTTATRSTATTPTTTASPTTTAAARTATTAPATTAGSRRTTTPATAATTATTARSVVAPAVRAEAEALLAAGATVAATAKTLHLAETTVRRWRTALTSEGRVPTAEHAEDTANERLFEDTEEVA